MIYFIQDAAVHLVKIGCADNPERRVKGLQTGSPSILTLLATMGGDRRTERELHARFAADRVRGEWFRPSEQLMALVEECRSMAARPNGSRADSPKDSQFEIFCFRSESGGPPEWARTVLVARDGTIFIPWSAYSGRDDMAGMLAALNEGWPMVMHEGRLYLSAEHVVEESPSCRNTVRTAVTAIQQKVALA